MSGSVMGGIWMEHFQSFTFDLWAAEWRSSSTAALSKQHRNKLNNLKWSLRFWWRV